MKNQLAMGAVLALFLPFTSVAQSAREAVVAAEESFAAQAAQAGTKAAFLAHSAPNAQVVEAGKFVNAQEVWAARPNQSSSRLTWYPVLADVAQSGDVGYTTGPWMSFKNDQPQAAGEYVTVWRKQPDGKWKFAVDMGIERIGVAPGKSANVLQPHLLAAAATPSTAPSNILLDVDRKFIAAEVLQPGATYQQYLSAEARLYRPGLSMMQGSAASANMKTMKGRYFFGPTGAYLGAAGDLGYVVGTVRYPAEGKTPEENGTYLRIWRREAVAGWRIVLEIFNYTPRAVEAAAVPATEGGATGLLPGKRSQ
jgi:ketosteroid isomerase-like protein